jgi:hypothetical protein
MLTYLFNFSRLSPKALSGSKMSLPPYTPWRYKISTASWPTYRPQWTSCHSHRCSLVIPQLGSVALYAHTGCSMSFTTSTKCPRRILGRATRSSTIRTYIQNQKSVLYYFPFALHRRLFLTTPIVDLALGQLGSYHQVREKRH